MALKKLVYRFTKSTEDSDRERLAAFCDDLDVTHLDELPLRVPVRFAGEITSVRIVPRAGAPALEVNISDGRGSPSSSAPHPATSTWTGTSSRSRLTWRPT